MIHHPSSAPRDPGWERCVVPVDVRHAPEQLTSRAMPPANASRANSPASIDRIIGIMRDLHATLIIEHDAASVAELPAFPASAG